MKHNRLFTFLITVTFSCILCTFVHQARADSTVFSTGDVNGDGFVDAVDASAVLAEYAQISAELPESFSPAQKSAADVNNDGFNDAVDASQILSYYAYLSAGGTAELKDFINTPPAITMTSSVSEILIPTTTTIPQEYLVNGYSKYDLLSDDTEKAVQAFKNLSSQLRNEMYGSYIVRGSWGGSNGADQAKVILAALNYNQGIAPEVLASNETLGTYSQDELIQYCEALDIAGQRYNGLNFNKYMLDEELANYFTDLIAKYDNWRDGDEESLLDELEQHNITFELLEPEKIENIIKTYMYTSVCYHTDGWPQDRMTKFLANNLITPMYQSYEQYITK
ncbi:dockerin type I domain-containing protein [Ruminococcus sp.]|uniref:dockerin type I domain-containing protein n=1 Tax=Ruminococcus sp. TaxID=41978 RepID=UPI0025D6DB74|nr:dockerin type I domain-containing protein [Ruminococcus sp.]